MELKDIKVGGKYKVKPENKSSCRLLANDTFDYIEITSIGDTGGLRYKTTEVSCSLCYKPEHLEPYEPNPSTNVSTNLTPSFMDAIVTFAKELVLSKEEKLLRKHGLKDTCGTYTEAAKEIMLQKLCKESEQHLAEIAQKKEDEEAKK